VFRWKPTSPLAQSSMWSAFLSAISLSWLIRRTLAVRRPDGKGAVIRGGATRGGAAGGPAPPAPGIRRRPRPGRGRLLEALEVGEQVVDLRGVEQAGAPVGVQVAAGRGGQAVAQGGRAAVVEVGAAVADGDQR